MLYEVITIVETGGRLLVRIEGGVADDTTSYWITAARYDMSGDAHRCAFGL